MELKPCPFCGSEAVIIPTSRCSGRIVCIGDCGIRTGKFWDEPMTEPEENQAKWRDLAIEAWNRRAENA